MNTRERNVSETDPVFEALSSLEYRAMGKSENQAIRGVIHRYQNHLEYIQRAGLSEILVDHAVSRPTRPKRECLLP
jgi:hypothetical protein